MQKKNIHFLTQAAMIAALYVSAYLYSQRLRPCQLCSAGPLFRGTYHSADFHHSGYSRLIYWLYYQQLCSQAAPCRISFSGSIATLIGAFGTYKLEIQPLPGCAPSHYANAVIVPLVLKYALRNRTSLVLIRNCYSRRDNFLWSAWPHTCRGAE